MDITPSDKQNAAIKAIVEWYGDSSRPEFYLAGFAGVGKSTIVEFAKQEIIKKYKIGIILTGAYTGKAASVLRKKGNPGAGTIHSLIYTPKKDPKTGMITQPIEFIISGESPASMADLIILDECSMIADEMANDLRSFGKKILVMGDPGQLPPVKGQGAFTRNEPDFFLDEIHRQSADSPIIQLATAVRTGKKIDLGYYGQDVDVIKLRHDSAELIHKPDTQVICGVNKVRWTITQRMRSKLGYTGSRPIVEERIICCQNNNLHGIFNGNMGLLKEIEDSELNGNPIYLFQVEIEDMIFHIKDLMVDPYLFENHFINGGAKKIITQGGPRLDQFDFGYVITCHKAQGSSWPHVTIIDDSASFREDHKKWLYTAITRAESGLTLLMR